MTDLEQIKYFIKSGGCCDPDLNCDFCIMYKTHNECLGLLHREKAMFFAKAYLRNLKLKNILNEEI